MKTVIVGMAVSSHIDVPIQVPEDFDLRKCDKHIIREKISNGEFKCQIEDLEETVQELFEGQEVNPDSVFHYEYELFAQPLQMKKITYIMSNSLSGPSKKF